MTVITSLLLITLILCIGQDVNPQQQTNASNKSTTNRPPESRYVTIPTSFNQSNEQHQHQQQQKHPEKHPDQSSSLNGLIKCGNDQTSCNLLKGFLGNGLGPILKKAHGNSNKGHPSPMIMVMSGHEEDEQQVQPEDEQGDSAGGPGSAIRSSLSNLFGKLAKGVVYGGAQLARLNSRLLCTYLTHESEPDNEDQPTLYVFNDAQSLDRAFRIYADDEIDPEMLEEAKFDPSQMTVFLVHGWLGGIHNENWLSEAKNLALKAKTRPRGPAPSPNDDDDYSPDAGPGEETRKQLKEGAEQPFRPNVVVVDWSDLALGSLYTATQNSYKVSSRLARLLRQLSQVGQLKPQLMHCIGHSIGLHICGRAAREAFPQPVSSKANLTQLHQWDKFGRISGVDPGGFCYELDIRRSEAQFAGLRPSDALVTDAYYTNRSPFGNKYQVAQFNVRVNDAFFQRACSVWRRPEVAREYFRATVRFLMGNTGHNDMLTCDHYFATRLAYQSLVKRALGSAGGGGSSAGRSSDQDAACSLMAYSCPSYADFVRGRCALCRRNSPGDCYPMDFEYQRPEASVEHAWRHLERFWSFSRQADEIERPVAGGGMPGSVPYERRGVYYVLNNGTECSRIFRLRVQLSSSAGLIERNNPLFAKLIDSAGSPIKLWDSWRNRPASSVRLHGPWSLWSNNNNGDSDNGDQASDPDWKTALLEVPREEPSLDSFFRRISQVSLESFANSTTNILEKVHKVELDYLSSASRKFRSKYSRKFDLKRSVSSSANKPTSEQEE